MLGRAMVAAAPEGVEVAELLRGDVDLAQPSSVRRALRAHPARWIVNCAAYTAVDAAESEPDVARAINATAVGVIGETARAMGAAVLHVSTDYVFAGDALRPYSEDDAPRPINGYGQSKLDGELALTASGARTLIVRTQWLYGDTGKSFPETMSQRAIAGQPTRVVDDQTGRPTYAPDLAQGLWSLVANDAEGLFHIANGGAATWYEVARAVFDHFGAVGVLTSCSTAEYHSRARRPRYSVLATDKAERLIGALPPWRDALSRFLRGRDARIGRS
jgi:dTDP-4-dehydrorhamnose reductase